jgi:hypothetical protein
MKATPLDELRKPHPDQARIDALTAALLRATADLPINTKTRQSRYSSTEISPAFQSTPSGNTVKQG